MHGLDRETGKVTRSVLVIAGWKGTLARQDPQAPSSWAGTPPTTEPAGKKAHAVDLTAGEVTASGVLDGTRTELAVAPPCCRRSWSAGGDRMLLTPRTGARAPSGWFPLGSPAGGPLPGDPRSGPAVTPVSARRSSRGSGGGPGGPR